MNTRRAAARSFFIFEKNREDLDTLERLIGRIHQL
jgi:hypothetical protein